jgi:hypothetical protein
VREQCRLTSDRRLPAEQALADWVACQRAYLAKAVSVSKIRRHENGTSAIDWIQRARCFRRPEPVL